MASTNNNQFTLAVNFKAKAGQEERLHDELRALVEPTRAKPGCLNYHLHRDPEDPSAFMIYENWVSKDALDEHIGSDLIQGFLAKGDELFDRPPDLHPWTMVVAPQWG